MLTFFQCHFHRNDPDHRLCIIYMIYLWSTDLFNDILQISGPVGVIVTWYVSLFSAGSTNHSSVFVLEFVFNFLFVCHSDTNRWKLQIKKRIFPKCLR